MTDEIPFHPPTLEEQAEWLADPSECTLCGKTDSTDFTGWVKVTVSPEGMMGSTGPELNDGKIFTDWLTFCSLTHAGVYLLYLGVNQDFGGVTR